MTDVDEDEDLRAIVKRIRGPLSQRKWAEATGLGVGWVKMVESGETETLTRSKLEALLKLNGISDADKAALEAHVRDTKATTVERISRLETRMDRMEGMLQEILDRLPDRSAHPS